MKVLVSDKLGQKGLDILEAAEGIEYVVKTGMSPEELKEEIKKYDGIIIRSGTTLTADVLETADSLQVVGRAGVGVDNVDLEAASKKGIVVMNTPGGNTISTCEHTIAMMLSMSRNIPQADASLRRKEWKRSQFRGTELFNKTLGVVGFGRIGREVVKRMLGFGMKPIVFDPFISESSASQMDVEFVSFEELCKRSDYITMHIPKTSETKYLFNKDTFALMKDGVFIVNCARGGIVKEDDLYEALKSGKVKAAALDVFESEPPYENPLLGLDNLVAVPHLGASTDEAQDNVGIAVAEQVVDALLDKGIRNSVNMPSFDPETTKALGPWITLSERLGSFATQAVKGGKTAKLTITYSGEVTNHKLTAVTLSAIKGVLMPIIGEETVNYVNAPVLAKERGIEVIESKTSKIEQFSNAICMELETDKGVTKVVGTLFNNLPRLVNVNDYFVDTDLEGYMLVVHNQDKPGFVGEIGSLLGKNDVNIAEMTLGRKKEGETAITIINTDQEIADDTMKQINDLEKVETSRFVAL